MHQGLGTPDVPSSIIALSKPPSGAMSEVLCSHRGQEVVTLEWGYNLGENTTLTYTRPVLPCQLNILVIQEESEQAAFHTNTHNLRSSANFTKYKFEPKKKSILVTEVASADHGSTSII